MKMGGMAVNCMKCGRENAADQAFCEDCLAEMERYPVRPNTVVQIPKRPAPTKKSHQRHISPEEQIAALRKRCRRLMTGLVVAWLIIAALAATVGIAVYELDFQRLLGQNYSTVETEVPASRG